MATVSISLSQNTASTIERMATPAGDDSIADDVGLFFAVALGFTASHSAFTKSQQLGKDLLLSFDDGATSQITDFTLGANGKASASGVTDRSPGLLEMHLAGTFDYDYNVGNGVLSLLNSDAMLTSAAFTTLYRTDDPHYDATLGNATLGFEGQVHSAAGGDFSGVINAFRGKSDHFMTAMDATGSFQVSGNGVRVALLQQNPSVTGVMDGYHEQYADGSSIRIDGAAIAVTNSTGLDRQLVTNAANFPGNDVFTVQLPERLTAPWAIAAGDGDDVITLSGGGSQLSANGGNGNDRIVLNSHSHQVDGGAGVDTVQVSALRASVTIDHTASGYQLRYADGSSDTLQNVERLMFGDGTLALDLGGNAGQTYRLYQAAFNRTPDQAGLGYWIAALDRGASLRDVATYFVRSTEFQSLYGAAPSNRDFLNGLYHNVLHRDGDAGGFAWWLDKLDTHAASFTDLLLSFSESPENQAALAPAISGGIPYTPWG